MSLSRRTFSIFAGIFAGAALAIAGLQAANPQVRGKSPPAARGPGALGLHGGETIVIRAPQFKVEALWFKANDETGWYWTGSDEVYAVFSDMDPTHTDRTTSEYDNVDEGDLVNFRAGDTCMAPQPDCVRGMADLNVRFSFWESDWEAPLGFSYCNGPDSPGLRWRLEFGECVDDDFIGEGAIIHSRAELVAMLPAVGDRREVTVVMSKNAGRYRFRYRITRLANIERPLVIELPRDWDLPPAITLQAAVGGGIGSTVTLTWSGATTTNVDINRNGTNIITTANDGTHVDPVTAGTYQYRICNAGTTDCSNIVTVTVP